MHKHCVLLGVLFLLTFSLPGLSQEEGQTGTTAETTPAGSPDATPDMPGEITIKSTFGNVVLPHDIHIKKVKLKCNVCHHQIKAKMLDTPHQDYLDSSWISCQTCHAENSEFTKKYYKCSVCHHSEPNNIADETLSSKVVIHKSCWKCHEIGTGKEASKTCGQCHEGQ
jgi:hypothetical protein